MIYIKTLDMIFQHALALNLPKETKDIHIIWQLK